MKTGPLPAAEIRKLARAAQDARMDLAQAEGGLGIRSEKVVTRDGGREHLRRKRLRPTKDADIETRHPSGIVGTLPEQSHRT